MALGMVLLQGPRGRQFLMSEVPMYLGRIRPGSVSTALTAVFDVTKSKHLSKMKGGVYGTNTNMATMYRGTSLIRKRLPPRPPLGPWA